MDYKQRIAPKLTIHYYDDSGNEEQFTTCDWSQLDTYKPTIAYTEMLVTLHLSGMPAIKLDSDYGRWTMWLEKTGRFLHEVEQPILEWGYTGSYWEIIPLEE